VTFREYNVVVTGVPSNWRKAIENTAWAGPSLEGSAATNETLSESLNVISYAVLGPASQLMSTDDVNDHVMLSAVPL
jgi:hypothetical protein